MSENATIVAHGLVKEYRSGVRALDRVSFTVRQAEIFAYLGRNGSGKTTTVRILTTLTPLSEGTAHVAGLDVRAEPAAVRSRIGVTMQDAMLDPIMTGREHLELAAGLWGLPARRRAARAAELLEFMGLTEAATRRIGQYSAGMRRRLDIATALLAEPQVLFLDEPTTGLDPQSRRALWDEIRRLKADGTTIFLTTQYIEEADLLADHLAVLDRGRIIAGGTTTEMKQQYGTTSVELRVTDPAGLERLRAALGRHEIAGESDPLLGRLTIPGGAAASGVLDLAAQIRRAGVELASISVTPPELEDVFVQLTGYEIAISAAAANAEVDAEAEAEAAGVGR